MPIYEYQSEKETKSCDYCRAGFECMRRLSEPPLTHCPECGAKIRKLISVASIGGSQSSFDDRAKSAGFHKLKKLGSGEYEKQY